jgi:bleomycin hydrolase
MKKWSVLFFLSSTVAFAQVESKSNVKEEILFTVVQNNAHGHVEDQCQTGTCWSFATVSFLEAEVLRLKKTEVDLSEMANPRYMYSKKVDSYVRFQGKQQLGPGGLSHDVIQVMREYGVVPESSFSGFYNGANTYNHNVIDAYMESISKLVLDKKLNETNPEWKAGVEALLDTYIGKLPTQFDYNGKKYTPETFRNELGLNPNDYVLLTSFNHHPFYSSFVLEVPDNWSKGQYYNLPINEFQSVADNALKSGYTIAWDADVSEPGFSFKNNMALLPQTPFKKEELFTQKPNEVQVTQESRQADFDSFATTDDHLMHIVGTSKDQWGNLYYITKNSWGEKNVAKGYQHVSQSYFRGKTVCMVVHKDAVPSDLRKKMGI